MNDERRSLPSASGMSRLAACEGSWHLEQAIRNAPDYVEARSEIAERGDRIHAWLKDESVELDPTELDVAESIREIEDRTRDAWAIKGASILTRRENRIWFEQDGVEIFSGQPDMTCVQENRALILDAKSGFAKVPHSSVNFQLASLAVLLTESNPHIHTVDVGIVQPFVSHKVELTHYDSRDLQATRTGILQAIRKAHAPDAPFKTGDHCNYCEGALVCPLRQQELKTIAALTIHEPDLVVTNEDLSALLDKCGRVLKLVGEIKGEARRRIEAGQVIDGWELIAGKGRRKVTDVSAVAERLNLAGATWTDIAGASSISITAVKELARSASKLKGMALNKFVDGVLRGAVAVSETKMALHRVGAALEDGEES